MTKGLCGISGAVVLLSVLWLSGTSNAQLINCKSVLVRLFPNRFPHCSCQYTYGPYSLSRQSANITCPSGQQYVLTRTKTSLSSRCKSGTDTKTVCVPSLEEKARNFIDSLSLGSNHDGEELSASQIDLTLSIEQPQSIPSETSFNLSDIYDDFAEVLISKPKKRRAAKQQYLSPNHPKQSNRVARNVPVPCPNGISKKICENITDATCRGRRSTPEEDAVANKRLADLILAQDHFYSNSQRTRRQTRPAAPPRNVFFIVDSSGSIGRGVYSRVLKALQTIVSYFCGGISVGMLTYSSDIELEFCPKCNLNNIQKKIESARHHRYMTHTGEVVKCLADTVIPSSGCRDLSKKTQLVFFTDGGSNGCLNPGEEILRLQGMYPDLETYSIGMGNINSNGVKDLIAGNNFDARNIFSVDNIDELEKLIEKVLYHLLNFSATYQCATTRRPSGR